MPENLKKHMHASILWPFIWGGTVPVLIVQNIDSCRLLCDGSEATHRRTYRSVGLGSAKCFPFLSCEIFYVCLRQGHFDPIPMWLCVISYILYIYIVPRRMTYGKLCWNVHLQF